MFFLWRLSVCPAVSLSVCCIIYRPEDGHVTCTCNKVLEIKRRDLVDHYGSLSVCLFIKIV